MEHEHVSTKTNVFNNLDGNKIARQGEGAKIINMAFASDIIVAEAA